MTNVNKSQDMRPSLSDVMDFLNSDYEQDKADINAAIADEAATRENADNVLQQHIESETNRATQAETELSNKITAETNRATLAEQDITAHLEAAEEELEGKITAETSRATQAESDLDGKITAETNRATLAENSITSTVIPTLAGTGLSYDSSTGKLNGVQADDITLGMVTLPHDVSHQDEQEFAITADGVAAYAPSKTETINQPESVEFTDVLSGVTLQVLNPTRIGGLIVMGIQITTNSSTTISAATRIAKTPAGLIKGIAVGISSTGNHVMQMDTAGISCNKSIEPALTLYFLVVGFYEG